MRNSAKTSLGGIITALSLITMLMSAVIPNLEYALPAIAGTMLVLMVIEISKKWALCAYVAVSILSILILPNKEAAMMYIAFFGHYPIVKPLIEGKVKNSPIAWILKALVFNVSVVLAYMVTVYVFGIPIEDIKEHGMKIVPVLLALGNVMFVLYDICITRLVTLYLVKYQKRFRKLFKS